MRGFGTTFNLVNGTARAWYETAAGERRWANDDSLFAECEGCKDGVVTDWSTSCGDPACCSPATFPCPVCNPGAQS